MTTFLIVAALMVAAALAWVLWPLLRPARKGSVERRIVNLTVYKDQFADLDADLARGSLSRAQYDEAKAELERRMIRCGRRRDAGHRYAESREPRADADDEREEAEDQERQARERTRLAARGSSLLHARGRYVQRLRPMLTRHTSGPSSMYVQSTSPPRSAWNW